MGFSFSSDYGNLVTGAGSPEKNGIVQLSPAELTPWTDPETGKRQPFLVNKTELAELTESIEKNGIRDPLIIRKVGDVNQILSGERRWTVATDIALEKVPCIFVEVSDDEARILLVQANLLSRQSLRPSERAFAYEMQYTARQRQGYRSDLDKLMGGEEISSPPALKENVRTIQRYIRLTYLLPELLEKVDAGKVKLVSGVALSFFSKDDQQLLFDEIYAAGKKITDSEIGLLRDVSSERPLVTEDIKNIFSTRENPIQKSDKTLDSYRSFFPDGTPDKKITETITTLLAEWSRTREQTEKEK